MNVAVAGTVGMQTVGVNVRAGHREVNFDCVCRGLIAGPVARFESHPALGDPAAEARQSLRESSGAIFERSGAIDAAK